MNAIYRHCHCRLLALFDPKLVPFESMTHVLLPSKATASARSSPLTSARSVATLPWKPVLDHSVGGPNEVASVVVKRQHASHLCPDRVERPG